MKDSASVLAAMMVLFAHAVGYLNTDAANVLLLSLILIITGNIASKQ